MSIPKKDTDPVKTGYAAWKKQKENQQALKKQYEKDLIQYNKELEDFKTFKNKILKRRDTSYYPKQIDQILNSLEQGKKPSKNIFQYEDLGDGNWGLYSGEGWEAFHSGAKTANDLDFYEPFMFPPKNKPVKDPFIDKDLGETYRAKPTEDKIVTDKIYTGLRDSEGNKVYEQQNSRVRYQDGGGIPEYNYGGSMLEKANYGMNIPQNTQGQFPAPPVGALNSPAYAQAYSKYMSNNPNLGMQPNQFASRNEFMYAEGGPTGTMEDVFRRMKQEEFEKRLGNPDMSEFNEYDKLANKYLAANKTYTDEKNRVEKARKNLVNLAKRKSTMPNPGTRTGLQWIGNGRYYCNSHTCELLSDAGVTVSDQESTLPLGSRQSFSGGENFPLIPGNDQMDSFSKKAGFKWVDKPQEGDLVREQIFKNRDYQGNEFSPRWVTSHSLIYGKDSQGNPVHYNSPGGKRNLYTADPASKLEDAQDDNMRLRYLRYMGNLPEYEKDLLKQKEDFKNKPIPKAPRVPVQLFENNILPYRNYGGPTVPYTKETSTAFSGNRGQGPLQAGFNNDTPGEYPAISFARNSTTQNVDPRQWANLVVGDLNKPMGVTDTIESMSKNTGATSKRVPMDIYFKNGGKLPKAEGGMDLSGITDFLGSEQGGQLMNTVGQLAPIVQGMMNKPQQGQRPMQTPQQGMMNPYGMPYTNNPYLPQPQQYQAPTYGGFTYGGLSGKEAEALGMPNYGRQFAYGGMLPKHGFGDFLTSAADAATETMGSGMKIMDPLNIGYGTALSRGMGNLVGEDRYQKGWDQFTDGTQAFVGGAAKGAAGVLPGQMGSLATKGMDAVSGIADNALNNNEYGQLYEGQDKLKQIAGGAGQIGGAVGGGILTGNVAGAVGSGMQGAGNVMQGIDMNNAGEQTGGGWQTAGNITNAASGLASFLPIGAYGGKLPSYGFGNQIGLPGYMGDKDKEITINAMNRATPIQSMYNQTPQYQHGMGQSMRGFGPGNQMAYGEMFAKGGKLPSYNHGGPHNEDSVYSMMEKSKGREVAPAYFASRGSFNNNPDGTTTMENSLQQMDISGDDYLEIQQALKNLETEQEILRNYYNQQNYSQTQGIPVDKVNELSPTYYSKMQAYQDLLKDKAGIENTNLAGNIEGGQVPYSDQAFGFRHNSYRPGLHAAERYGGPSANVSEYDPRNVNMGQQRYTRDGRERLGTEQNTLLRNEEIPTDTGLKSENMMFYGNTKPIGVVKDETGRKYLQAEDGSNLGYFGEDFAYGGNLPSYHNGGKGTGHPHDTISKSLTNKNLIDLKIPKYTKDPNYKYGFSKAEGNNIMAGAGFGNDKIGAGLFGMAPSSSKDRKYFKGMVDANINYNVNPNLNLKLGMNDVIGGGFKPGFNAGVKYKFQDGGAMQGQHPQAQYEVEKDEIMYHPNDKPVSLANGGLNQVANDYSKVTGNKHSHPNGGPQMAGGEGGYVYSDQLKVPKDLYNSLKGLI